MNRLIWNAPERTYANSFSYTASGGIERMKLGNNRWETAKFNERAQLTEIGIGLGANDNSVWKLEYKYGEFESGSVNANKNTGNIARSVMTLAGVATPIVQNYGYDTLYRLTGAEETAGATQNWIQQFQYDRFGNRIAFNRLSTRHRARSRRQRRRRSIRHGKLYRRVQPVAERRQNLAVVRKPTENGRKQDSESRERRHGPFWIFDFGFWIGRLIAGERVTPPG